MLDAMGRILAPTIGNERVSVYRGLRIEAVDAFKRLYPVIPSRERRFQAYALGLPRSGTHSIAYTFSEGYRASHEPLNAETIAHLLRWKEGEHTDEEMGRLLRFRDRLLQLEVEASFYMHYFSGLLPDLFPKARFILTVREPLAWTESLMNQMSCVWGMPFWRELARYRHHQYDLEFEHDALRDAPYPGLFPLRSYLRYWTDHLTTVIDCIPKDRLMVVDTYEIESRIEEIATFIGADSRQINVGKAHSGSRNSKKIRLEEVVSYDEALSEVKKECEPLISNHFPFLKKHINYVA